MADTTAVRLERARHALDGLSVGDAFGETFFGSRLIVQQHIRERALVEPPWWWTDDTNMALSIYEVLRIHGAIDQAALAHSFATHFDSARGYGAGAWRLLQRIGAGEDWSVLAPAMFGNSGSFGNGSAMRIAPLGAYFADDLEAAIDNASKASEVTHSHPEGIAGGIAIAVAAAIAYQARGEPLTRPDFIDRIMPYIPPDSAVYTGTRKARDTRAKSVEQAVTILGNGSQISAMDTVPFVLWSAGEWLFDYKEALWQTASGLGDVDTTCAMVGGIVACYTGPEAIPADWLDYREALPEWPFTD